MGILILISTEPLSRPNPSESSNIEFTFHQSFLTAILTIKTTNAQVNKILQKRKKKKLRSGRIEVLCKSTRLM